MRTVADAAAVFDVIAGSDPADPVTSSAQGRRPDSYLTSLDKNGLMGARIGVLRQLLTGPYPEPDADPEIVKLFEAALVSLTSADLGEVGGGVTWRMSCCLCTLDG